MSYADDLRLEITNYLNNLSIYMSADFTEQIKILSGAIHKEEEKYKLEVLPKINEYKDLQHALDSLEKFPMTARKIEMMIKDGLNGGNLDDTAVKEQYKKLVTFRETIIKVLPASVEVDDLKSVKKNLIEREKNFGTF